MMKLAKKRFGDFLSGPQLGPRITAERDLSHHRGIQRGLILGLLDHLIPSLFHIWGHPLGIYFELWSRLERIWIIDCVYC
jgi:hypothetical protein